MTKKLKIPLIVTAVIFILAAASFIAFRTFIHTIYFEYDDIGGIGCWTNDDEYNEYERLMSEGYIISRPNFRNKTPWGEEDTKDVYSAVNKYMFDYASEITETYKNYAKLDYTVNVKENETLTVAFTGMGYFYDEREPVGIDKTFVFDIRNASVDNPPKLISE